MLRGNRKDFKRLYIQNPDRYYLGLAKTMTVNSEAQNRVTDYDVTWECKPWLLSDTMYTISGAGLINTGARNITNGGWSPTKIALTGTNVTVSGYTDTIPFTGYISVSGFVDNLIIDSEEYEVTLNGERRNDLMRNYEFQTYVGPDKTYFNITGATHCVITYQDRWYL
jgi:phage-related protein